MPCKIENLHFLAYVGLLGDLRSGSLGRSGFRSCGLLRGSSLLGCGLLSLAAFDNGSLLDSVGLLRCGLARTARLGFGLRSGCRSDAQRVSLVAELDAATLNRLIKEIVVHERIDEDKTRHISIEIHFNLKPLPEVEQVTA